MVEKLVDVIRREYSIYDLLLAGAFLVLLYTIIESAVVVAGIGIGLLVIALMNVVTKLPDVPSRSGRIARSAVLLIVSASWFVYGLATGAGIENGIPAILLVGAVWLVITEVRSDVTQEHTATEAVSSTEAMVQLQHTQLVIEELQRGPKTATELANDCDLTESRVKQALQILTDDDGVYVIDHDEGTPKYAVNESKLGKMAFVRFIGKRLLRPLSVSR